jgi:hypothetical protein
VLTVAPVAMERVASAAESIASAGQRNAELAPLVARMADGDETALAAFYDTTSPVV